MLLMLQRGWGGRALAGLGLLVLFTAAAQALSIASWTNQSLNAPGPIPATFGSGSLSRGPGLTYLNASSLFSSTHYSTGTLLSDAIAQDSYAQISVDASLYNLIHLFATCGRESSSLGPKFMRVYISTNGAA